MKLNNPKIVLPLVSLVASTRMDRYIRIDNEYDIMLYINWYSFAMILFDNYNYNWYYVVLDIEHIEFDNIHLDMTFELFLFDRV